MNESIKEEIQAHIANLELEIERSFRITSELDPNTDIYWIMFGHYKETKIYQQELNALLERL